LRNFYQAEKNKTPQHTTDNEPQQAAELLLSLSDTSTDRNRTQPLAPRASPLVSVPASSSTDRNRTQPLAPAPTTRFAERWMQLLESNESFLPDIRERITALLDLYDRIFIQTDIIEQFAATTLRLDQQPNLDKPFEFGKSFKVIYHDMNGTVRTMDMSSQPNVFAAAVFRAKFYQLIQLSATELLAQVTAKAWTDLPTILSSRTIKAIQFRGATCLINTGDANNDSHGGFQDLSEHPEAHVAMRVFAARHVSRSTTMAAFFKALSAVPEQDSKEYKQLQSIAKRERERESVATNSVPSQQIQLKRAAPQDMLLNIPPKMPRLTSTQPQASIRQLTQLPPQAASSSSASSSSSAAPARQDVKNMKPAFNTWGKIIKACEEYFRNRFPDPNSKTPETYLRYIDIFIAQVKDERRIPLAAWRPDYFASMVQRHADSLMHSPLKHLGNIMFPYDLEFDMRKGSVTTRAQEADMATLASAFAVYLRDSVQLTPEQIKKFTDKKQIIEPFCLALEQKGVRYRRGEKVDTATCAKIREAWDDTFSALASHSNAFKASRHLLAMLLTGS